MQAMSAAAVLALAMLLQWAVLDALVPTGAAVEGGWSLTGDWVRQGRPEHRGSHARPLLAGRGLRAARGAAGGGVRFPERGARGGEADGRSICAGWRGHVGDAKRKGVAERGAGSAGARADGRGGVHIAPMGAGRSGAARYGRTRRGCGRLHGHHFGPLVAASHILAAADALEHGAGCRPFGI